SRPASRRTSSLPFWPIACTSRWRGACARWHRGSRHAACWEKFAAVQMIDVHLPTTDGRELLLSRYTEPEPELTLLLQKLKLELPAQPPPKITAAPAPPSPL